MPGSVRAARSVTLLRAVLACPRDVQQRHGRASGGLRAGGGILADDGARDALRRRRRPACVEPGALQRRHRLVKLHPGDRWHTARHARRARRRGSAVRSTDRHGREPREEQHDRHEDRKDDAECEQRVEPRPPARRRRDDRPKDPGHRIVDRIRQRDGERPGGRVAAVWLAGQALRDHGVGGLRKAGLDGASDLNALRGRLISAGVPWAALATTTAQILLLAERPREALEHAALAKDHLAAGSQRFGLDVAVICAIEAARRLGDEAALDDWIAVALRDEIPVGSLVRQARRAYGNAARAARNAQLAAAIAFSAESVAALDHSQWPYIETIARLRHAELLLERASASDRAAAAAELATVLTFWRRAGAP